MVAQLDMTYVKIRPARALVRLMSYLFFEGRPATTRGRFINPIVLTLLNFATRIPGLKEVRQPIFILGTGRSGTTILGVVLSMHRDVGFLNEPKAIWHTICSSEDVIGNYTLGRAQYVLEERDAALECIDRARRIFGMYLACTGSQRLVDKYPELIFRFHFVRKIFPDAKFIFLARNGWDTCHSIDAWSRRHGVVVNGVRHDWWGVDNRKWHLMVDELVPRDPELCILQEQIAKLDNDVDRAAVEWILTMRQGLSLLSENSKDIHLVRYEDLTRSPEATMEQILEFCALPKDDVFLQYAKSVLRSTSPRPRIALHHAIVPAFEETLNKLGYQ